MQRERRGVQDLINEGVLVVGYRAKRVELADEGLPFARAANIDEGFHFDGAELLSPEGVRRAGHKVSKPGDVVFTSKGTVGRFALVGEDTPRFAYSPQLCFWRSLDPAVLDPGYLFYWMQSDGFMHQVNAVKGQTDMADYVSLRDQRHMEVDVPPIGQQRRIAAVLGALDDKIALNRRMNRTLEETAQVLFRRRFVEFDGRDDLVDSGTDLGPIPPGWRVDSLDGIAHFLNGTACQKYPAVEGEPSLPVIKIRELNNGVTENTDCASLAVPEKFLVEDGDVLFSWSGTLLAKVWTGGRGLLNQHLFKVTSDRFSRWFYLLWVQHHLAEFQHIASTKATTMGHIKRHHLSDALCAVPPAPELEQLHRQFHALIDRHVANDLQSGTLAALRDALLPRLISGEIRVLAPLSPLDTVVTA